LYDRRLINKPSTSPVHRFVPTGVEKNANAHVTGVAFNHDGTEILANYSHENIYLFDVNKSNLDNAFNSFYNAPNEVQTNHSTKRKLDNSFARPPRSKRKQHHNKEKEQELATDPMEEDVLRESQKSNKTNTTNKACFTTYTQ